MPEILEIEMYRRGAAPIVGRTISGVDAPDDWYLKDIDARAIRRALVGATIQGTGRIGKLMLVDTTSGTVGLRFGMTGRLVIDGTPIIAALEYSSKRLDPDWDRFRLEFDDGGTLAMNDPRRLGGVSLAPDIDALGPDVWTIGRDDFAAVVGSSRVAIKALLLNQKRLAGLGNLLADELLWRAGLDPRRSARELGVDDVHHLWSELGPMLDDLYERGGSHLGDHVEARGAEIPCPRDGGAMMQVAIGGRTTWWCTDHQR